MENVLVVDLGGTKTAVGIVDEEGRILAKTQAPTPLGNAETVVGLVRAMAEGLGWNGARPRTLGLALPGVMDHSRRTLISSPSSGWQRVPFVELFEKALDLSATADNDVNACAVAESVFGGAKGMDDFVWITVSTGVGGAAFCNGRVLRGARGMGAEIGHLVVKADGAPCLCGSRGCLEAEAAGPAWIRLASEEGGAGYRDAEAVAEGARRGEAACLRVVERAAGALGAGIAAAIQLMDPQAVFLGGGVAASADLLIPHAERRVAALSLNYRTSPVPILPSPLGRDAALLGAAALAFGYDA